MHPYFGRNQFANIPERSARDALAQLVLTWICIFGKKRKVPVYYSDVFEAFDKVNCQRPIQKLRTRCVPDDILMVIESWLSEWKVSMAVGGEFSQNMQISNMIYQGTVFGPPIWNALYADAAIAVNLYGVLEIMFADDLNCFKNFGLSLDNIALVQDMTRCQQELHK